MLRAKSAIAIAVAGCALMAGCSSSGSGSAGKTDGTAIIPVTTTTGTTLPPHQLAAALKTFFASVPGKKLLEFERVTPELANGKVPQIAVCRKFIKEILPPIGQPAYLEAISAKIPDPDLALAWHRDIGGKDLLLAGCDTGQRPPQSAADTIHGFQVDLIKAMAKHGYKI